MRKMKHILFLALAAFALAACTQDELAEQGAALPEGKYPITFSAMQVVGAEPQTRVSENADGTGSLWTQGDKIEIDIYEGLGEYLETTLTVDADGNVIAQSPQLYWPNTGDYVYEAIYCNIEGEESTTDQTVSFGDQSEGLAYVLLASGSANCHSGEIALTFKHALNKVRVKLEGVKADDVASVSVKNYTSVNVSQYFVQGGTEGHIKMYKVISGDETYWEANVAPVADTNPAQIQDFRLYRSDGTYVDCKLDAPIDPNSIEGGKMFTVTINVKSAVVQDGATLTEAGDYTMSGTYAQGVTINGDGINLTLDGATINTSGIGINITGGNPTIKVSGMENTITSTGSAGIYVAQGSTVTITGGSRDDRLTARSNSCGAGIGGYITGPNNGIDCGNITISNVTVYSYGSQRKASGDLSAGIGGASSASCGTITIDNATIHAYGVGINGQATPAIGSGMSMISSPSPIPTVTITGESEVHAHRDGSDGKTDYIGWAGFEWGDTNGNNEINLGGGTCTSSTVYCYTGETLDKTVKYDENGVGTEQ